MALTSSSSRALADELGRRSRHPPFPAAASHRGFRPTAMITPILSLPRRARASRPAPRAGNPRARWSCTTRRRRSRPLRLLSSVFFGESPPTSSTMRRSTSSDDLRPVTQLRVERHLGGIALRRQHGGHEIGDVVGDVGGREAARFGHRRAVAEPQRVQVREAFLAIFGRHVGAHVDFGGALVGADAEQVDLDAELVEEILVVRAIALVAVDGRRGPCGSR